MLATKHTQSLTDFRQSATETLERINRTGEAEILTVNGEARAVMMSPAAFDELAKQIDASRYAESLRRAMQEMKEGKGRSVDEVFDAIRTKLLAVKAGRK